MCLPVSGAAASEKPPAPTLSKQLTLPLRIRLRYRKTATEEQREDQKDGKIVSGFHRALMKRAVAGGTEETTENECQELNREVESGLQVFL